MSPPRSHGPEVPGARCKPWPSCWRAEEKHSIWSLRSCPRTRPLLCAAVVNAATRGVVRRAMGCRAGCNVPFPVS